MYYDITIVYRDGKIETSSLEPQELNDMLGYCRIGKQDGYIRDYHYVTIRETW